MTLSQISDAIQFDSGGMTHLLGGVTLDDDKRIAGESPFIIRACKSEFQVQKRCFFPMHFVTHLTMKIG